MSKRPRTYMKTSDAPVRQQEANIVNILSTWEHINTDGNVSSEISRLAWLAIDATFVIIIVFVCYHITLTCYHFFWNSINYLFLIDGQTQAVFFHIFIKNALNNEKYSILKKTNKIISKIISIQYTSYFMSLINLDKYVLK